MLPHTCPRLTLRRLRDDDLVAFQAYRQDASVGRYQGWKPQTDAAAQAFLRNMRDAEMCRPGQWNQIGIAVGDTLVGDIGLCLAEDGDSVELGFSLSAQAQGQGLATEAVAATIALMFAHTPARRIRCVTDARNAPCIRLLERLGMRRTQTEATTYRGEACVEHTYCLARVSD